MNEFFSAAGSVIAVAAACVSLYAVMRNWMILLRRKTALDASPVFMIGPLFAVIAAGLFVQSQGSVAGIWPWMFPVLVACIDPAALPMIVSGILRRRRDSLKSE